MLVIGITGGSGSGKSYICNALRKNGYHIIDADQIAREIVMPGRPALQEILSAFGNDILFDDGSLNRKALGKIVFSNADKLQTLNEITHKYIIKQIKNDVQTCNSQCCVIDAPLLYACGLDALCDVVIGITASRDIRAQRIVLRDNISQSDALERICAQSDIDDSLNCADLIIDTSHNPSAADLLVRICNFIEGVSNE